jgi:putative peptidoglycan lipid II flippase
MIGPGLDFESKLLSTRLFNLSLFLIFFTLIGSFVNTTLNAEQIFGRTEFTALLNGLISIGILFFFYEKFGVFTLIYALLVGKIVEFLIGLYYLRKIGYHHHFIWNATDGYNLSKFFKVMLTTSGYVGATQIYSVTMTAMASYLPTGSLSIFNYVSQLTTKASSIIMGPITTVFFSNFSKIVSEQKENLTEHLKKPLVYVFMITFLVFIFIFLFGDELLHFLWSKKSLSASEFEIAYMMLFLNFFGFIFTATSSIFRKSSIALGHSGQLYRSWIIVQIFSAIYAFVSIYFFGIYGLISILIINMILMSLTTFYISEQAKLKSKEIITEFIFKNRNIFVIAAMMICTVGFNFLVNSFSVSKLTILTTKFMIWLIFAIFYLSYLHQNNILKLVNIFSKKNN